MRRAGPAVICNLPHTHTKNGAACCSAVRARVCWCAGATVDVSFRVHSSSSSPSQGYEYPSMSSFRVRVQWVRRTRTRIRVRVYRPRRTRTRNSNSVVALCRVPLFHRHDHTPHYDSAIRQPALFLPQVAGAAQEPRARIATNTLPLLVLKYRRRRRFPPAD